MHGVLKSAESKIPASESSCPLLTGAGERGISAAYGDCSPAGPG